MSIREYGIKPSLMSRPNFCSRSLVPSVFYVSAIFFTLGIRYNICINSVPVSSFLSYLDYMEIHCPFLKDGEKKKTGCRLYVNLCRLIYTKGIFFLCLL